MYKFLSRKKFLFLALLEDILLIFFLFTLIASGLEILLPGVLAHKLPLAFLFTAFAILALLYIRWIQKERLSYPQISLRAPLLWLAALFLVAVALFMTRAFGVWGAFLQVVLIVLAFFFWFQKK